MNLNPQAIKILVILEDGEKHCPIEWGYADGHGKRFTDITRYLNQFGQKLENDWCDCGRHTTKIKMRWIAPLEPSYASNFAHSGASTPKDDINLVQPLYQV